MTRGWKGNPLGLQRWEVECCHQARLDATEAVAELMRRGKSFTEAKTEVVRRADRVYRSSRPELYAGYRCCARDVQLNDMPKDITRKMEDDFLASIEKERGYRARWFDRMLFRMFGVVW